MFGVHVKVADDVDGALSMSVTVMVCVIPPPVTVIRAVFAPRAAVAVFTLTVIGPLFEPDVGLTVSHDALSLAVQAWLELTVPRIDLAGFAAPPESLCMTSWEG